MIEPIKNSEESKEEEETPNEEQTELLAAILLALRSGR
jgi:hypothetical protein